MRRVCVFCGSSVGGRPEYREAARALARALTRRGIGLVYGGSRVGLMYEIAATALEAGGEVIGVIPQDLADKEVAFTGLSDLRIVGSMHERKALMAELSDAVIALPGGTGTLDELFELMTWSHLGLHHKPVGLFDIAGYWRPLLAFLDHAVTERFLRAEHLDSLVVERSAPALVDRLASYRHRAQDKWPQRDQVVPNTRSPASPNPGRM